jgi:hypothetical protein
VSLTVQMIEDAKEDVLDLAQIMNGPAGQVVSTRFGGDIPTFASIVQQFSVFDPFVPADGVFNITGGMAVSSTFSASGATTIGSTANDSQTKLLVRGTARAVRIGTIAGAATIEGVDLTGSASYQPLSVGGTTVTVHSSGTTIASFGATGTTLTGTVTSGPLGAWAANRVLRTWGDGDGRTLQLLGRSVQDTDSAFVFSTANALTIRVDAANVVTFGPQPGATFHYDITVPDEAFGSGWNGSGEVPTKNAVHDALSRIAVDPRSFGALGDGTGDDRDEVIAAFTYAWANGLPIDGGDAVFAITNCQRIRIDRLEIDRGPSAAGDIVSNHGLLIQNGARHRVRNVEVFGGGDGNGIGIFGTTDSDYENLYAHDMVFNLPGATDDVMQGIHIANNSDCNFRNLRAADLTGNATAGAGFPSRFTRGIAAGGNIRCALINPQARNVDQGVDISSSAANVNFTVDGGRTYQCVTVGLKIANSGRDNKVRGHIAERCGMFGFHLTGPSGAVDIAISDIEFEDCKAVDPGYNDFPFPNRADGPLQAVGFCFWKGDLQQTFPKGVRVKNCHAIDRQAVKKMKYGFFNSMPFDAATGKGVELINSVSEGHTTASQIGFHRQLCRLTHSGTIASANNTLFTARWDTELEDSVGMHDPATNNGERVAIIVPGRYRIRAEVVYAGVAGGGYRDIRLMKNGVTNMGTNAFYPTAGNNTTTWIEKVLDLVAGDYLIVQGEQTSGGAVTINLNQSTLEVELLDRA